MPGKIKVPPYLAEEALMAVTEPLNIIDSEYRIVWANEARARLHQLPVEAMVGKHCYEVFQRRSVPCDDCPVAETRATGKPCTRERFSHRPDNGRVWTETSTWPVFDQRGKVVFIVEFSRNITERKMAEESIQAASLFQQAVIDGLPDPVMVIDVDHNIKLMNKAARQTYVKKGSSGGPLLCYSVSHDRSVPCSDQAHPCPLDKVRESGKTYTVVHANGGAIYCNGCSMTISNSTFNGNTAGAGGAIYLLNASTATITDTFIQGNSVTGSGGGISVSTATSVANMTNVMLTGNKASSNGGAIFEQGSSNCLFCTISGNYAGGLGGGFYKNSSGISAIRNSIIYNNYDANANTYEQIYSIGSSYQYITVSYTLINQVAGSPGYTDGNGNNISGNPYFVSPLNPSSAPTTGGDYHICGGLNNPAPCTVASPCIDAGSSSYPYGHDIFGNSRPLGSGYDMGANEKQ